MGVAESEAWSARTRAEYKVGVGAKRVGVVGLALRNGDCLGVRVSVAWLGAGLRDGCRRVGVSGLHVRMCVWRETKFGKG